MAFEGNLAADNDGIYAQRFTAGGLASGGAVPGQHDHGRAARQPRRRRGRRRRLRRRLDRRGRQLAGPKDATSRAGGGSWAKWPWPPAGAAGEDQSRRSASDGSGNFVVAGAEHQGHLKHLRRAVQPRRRPARRRRRPGQPVRRRSGDQAGLAVRQDGSYLIAWTAGGNQDGNGNGVYAQAYNADGAADGGKFLVNTTTQNNQQDAAAALAGGNALVAWDGNGPGDSAGVFFQRYAATQSANQSPANAVPGQQTTDENAPLTFSAANGNAITVSDADADGGAEQVAVSVNLGTLSISNTTGITITSGTASGGGAITFTGTLASLNAALNGLTFTPAANNTGTATLQILTSDLGNTGGGGAKTATSAVSIVGPGAGPAGQQRHSRRADDGREHAAGLLHRHREPTAPSGATGPTCN